MPESIDVRGWLRAGSHTGVVSWDIDSAEWVSGEGSSDQEWARITKSIERRDAGGNKGVVEYDKWQESRNRGVAKC